MPTDPGVVIRLVAVLQTFPKANLGPTSKLLTTPLGRGSLFQRWWLQRWQQPLKRLTSTTIKKKTGV